MEQVALNIAGLNGVLTETMHLNAPLWTLAYEIWFYVVGGAAGYLLWSRGQRNFAALAILAVGIAVFCMLDARYLAFWMLGGMSVFLLKTPHRGALVSFGAILAVAGVAFYQLSTGSKSFTSVDLLSPEIAEFLICLGVIMAIPFLCDDRINARLHALARPAQFLGGISFSLYLFHYPINSCLDLAFAKAPALDLQGWADFGLRLLICLLVVTVAWIAFERNTPAVRDYCRRTWLSGARNEALDGA